MKSYLKEINPKIHGLVQWGGGIGGRTLWKVLKE